MTKAARKPGWTRGALQLVIGKAENTTLPVYKFEDGSETQAPVETDLEVLADYCERAFKIVEIHKTALQDARNFAVECEGEVLKAEIVLEHHQKTWLREAAKRKGVPCPKP